MFKFNPKTITLFGVLVLAVAGLASCEASYFSFDPETVSGARINGIAKLITRDRSLIGLYLEYRSFDNGNSWQKLEFRLPCNKNGLHPLLVLSHDREVDFNQQKDKKFLPKIDEQIRFKFFEGKSRDLYDGKRFGCERE